VLGGAPPADDWTDVPSGSDVTLGETDEESVDGRQEPSIASGMGRVPCSVHSGVVRNLGVAMVTRVSVANQTPPPGGGDMGDMLVRMDAFQSTMASLAGRVAVVEAAAQRHTDMAAAIDGRFDHLLGLMQGLQANRGVVFGPPPGGRWSCRI
jgi:hypothetical protein